MLHTKFADFLNENYNSKYTLDISNIKIEFLNGLNEGLTFDVVMNQLQDEPEKHIVMSAKRRIYPPITEQQVDIFCRFTITKN